ncbi:MAG: methyltransferase domain-containing protein, partial [Gemmatimonadaceae bacterium]|nr:methyltransferase domain-containing protein [Gemmatimonadaceae bacterium]
DEQTSKRLEAAYNAPEIVRRRALARAALGAQPGDRVLDLGCGPGFYVTELLDEVGPKGSVVGVDMSADMLAIARHRASGCSNAEFFEAEATTLPFDGGQFDAAISVQVFEYVKDTVAGLAEVHRVLKPGGRIVVWDSDWDSVAWHSEDPGRMAAVLSAWSDHLVHAGLPRTLGASVRKAGFDKVQMQAYSFASTDLSPDGFVGALFPLVEAFVRNHPAVSTETVDGWVAEQHALSESGAFFFALTQCCFSALKPY